jgi:hypothetical protein
MKNTLPSKFKRLFGVAGDWIKGCLLLEVLLNILHFNSRVITNARNTAKAKEDAYQAAKSAKSAAVLAHANKAAEARGFVTLCREVLKPRFGKKWSPTWAVLGFTISFEVPKISSELLPLLDSLKNHFVANPTHEIADLGVTGGGGHNAVR